MQSSIALGYQWLMSHPAAMTTISLGVYHVTAAFVDSLPMPDSTSGNFYKFVFTFSNRLAANYSRAAASNNKT